MATESGGDETGDETGGPWDKTGDKMATTAGDERDGGDRWGNVYGRRELEFDEDKMAALEEQHLVAELFPDSGCEADFEGFHASEPAGNLSGADDSGSEAGRLSDAVAAAAYRTNPNLPD